MDRITKEQRSRIMSKIKGKDTRIEIRVRSQLHKLGFRFRKNDSRYPGKPDILLPKYRTAVFINGCFWHQHESCKLATVPKSNTEFWMEKFRKNKENDRKNLETLHAMGWNTYVLWECELKEDFDGAVGKLVEKLRANEKNRKETGVS